MLHTNSSACDPVGVHFRGICSVLMDLLINKKTYLFKIEICYLMAIVSIGFSASPPPQHSSHPVLMQVTATKHRYALLGRRDISHLSSYLRRIFSWRLGRAETFLYPVGYFTTLCLVLLIVFLHPSALVCGVLLDFRYI